MKKHRIFLMNLKNYIELMMRRGFVYVEMLNHIIVKFVEIWQNLQVQLIQ